MSILCQCKRMLPPTQLIVQISATELAHTITTVLNENERYKKPEDIIEHANKYGAYDFYGVIDPGQSKKWIKTVEKARNTL